MESSTIDRLVRMLDEERNRATRAETGLQRSENNYLTLCNDYTRATERAAEAEKTVRAWLQWRNDLKAKVPRAKQADWPTTPDHDDIPF